MLYYLTAGLVRLLGLLPVGWARILGRGLGRLACRVARRERRTALLNLQHARPELSPARRRDLTREVFIQLGQSVMECVVMARLRRRLGSSDSPVELAPGSLSTLQQAAGQGRGVLFVTAHLGNWELMGAEVARRLPVSVLFKPSYDPRFTRMIRRFRRASGINSIDVTRPSHLLQVVRALRRGEVLGVLLDQPVAGGEGMPFFGQPAPTTRLVDSLASRTGAAVVVGTIARRPGGRHRITIRRPEGQPPTLACLALIEQAIRADPAQWVWCLDRWRLARGRDQTRGTDSNASYIPQGNN